MTEIACGVEEPLQCNEQLSEFANGDSLWDGWVSPVEGLNRYSFVWLGRPVEASVPFGRLVGSVAALTGQPAHWFEWWGPLPASHDPVGDRTRSQRLAQDGWQVVEDQGLFAALRTMTHEEAQRRQEQWSRVNMTVLHLIWFGPTPDPEALLASGRDALAYSLRCAGGGVLTREMLVMAASAGSTIVYYTRSTTNDGLVVATPLRLPFRDMIPEGTRLGPVYEGPDAWNAWLLPERW